MPTITIRVPEALDADLEELSKKAGVSKSDIARDALRRQMNVMKLRRLRDDLVPFLEAQGVFTEEDVLKRLEEP
jgi:predicted transcriptional regulator